ncbi:ABC transporter substrate-binding protein [Rhodococcus sp. HM1]|uniref:ABC transporter substrate-binding protein n=1 Tax=Rhodococcus rhodochrous TaxID=1829 RepID=A0AA47AG48_RHORH|nr:MULTISPECIES: ABC transporter substrate-binding protein [Rhodococcus]MCK8672037.1 ABC transporter substrate-binding protein [Rhodococcus sp. HM1]UZF48008.1 ABC transporter substrate-binding protein [Rhodococcus rhodochrous]
MSLFTRQSALTSSALSRRRFLAIAGGVAASVPILAACGAPGGGSSSGGFAQPDVAPPAQFQGRTNIVFWSGWSGTNGEALAKLINRYNESQSDIYVEIQQFQGYDGLTEKLSAGLQARQIPDVAIFSDVSWNKFFLSGHLEPLGSHFTDTWNAETYHDRLFQEGVVRGEPYWVPFGRSTPLFYYNKDVFAQAGLPDRAPETWDEFRDWGNRITGRDYRGNKLMMRAYTGSDDWYFQGLLWNYDGAMSDGLDITVDSAAAIAAAEFDRACVNDDKIGYLAQEINTDFTNGLVATITNSTGSLTGLTKGAEASGFELGAGFLPVALDTGVPTGGAGLGILKNADPERKAAAAQVIAFLAEDQQAAEWAVDTGYLPATKGAATSSIVTQRIAENPNYGLAIDQLDRARQPDPARLFVGSTILEMRTVIQKLYTDNADPAAALGAAAATMRRDAEDIRAQYEELVA